MNFKGSLKIFLGMCDGVGKTYAMLEEAQHLNKELYDIAIGYINKSQPKDTFQKLEDFEVIPSQTIKYQGIEYEEMNLDAILQRKPDLVLVDDLAHSNIPGSKYKKRYLDVLEILNKGIDVYTTLNVYNLESVAVRLSEITGIQKFETVPDSVLEKADEFKIIEITPKDLLNRLAEKEFIVYDIEPIANYNFLREDVLHVLYKMTLNFNNKFIPIARNIHV